MNLPPLILLWLLPAQPVQLHLALAALERQVQPTHHVSYGENARPSFVHRAPTVNFPRMPVLDSSLSTPAALPVSFTVQRRRQPRDIWLDEDKAQHFAMAFFTVGLTQSVLRVVGVDGDGALAVGVVAGILASLGKEWYDRNTVGVFSYKDLVFDTGGMALAVLLLRNAR